MVPAGIYKDRGSEPGYVPSAGGRTQVDLDSRTFRGTGGNSLSVSFTTERTVESEL